MSAPENPYAPPTAEVAAPFVTPSNPFAFALHTISQPPVALATLALGVAFAITNLLYANAAHARDFSAVAAAYFLLAALWTAQEGITLAAARDLSDTGLVRPWPMTRDGIRAARSLFLLAFIRGLLVGLASLFLIVPGLLLAVRWALAPAQLFREQCTISDALGRSFDCTRGRSWRVAGVTASFGSVAILSATVTVLFRVRASASPATLALVELGTTFASTAAGVMTSSAYWSILQRSLGPAPHETGGTPP